MPRTIIVTVSLGLVGCKRSEELEIDDDATDDSIEAAAREVMFGLVEWNWRDKDR